MIAAALWARSRRLTRTAAVRPSGLGDLDVVSGLSPSQATGLRWALVRGPAARRLPVVSTLAAAISAVGMVVGLLVVSGSLDGLLATPARYGAPWDASVPVDPEAYAEDAARLARDPRVDEAALIGSGELTAETAAREPVQLPAVAYEPVAGRLEPVVLEGRVPGAPDEIALGSATYRALDVAVGDRLSLFGPGGTRRVRVVGRVIVPTVGYTDVQRGMVVPLSTFMDLGAAELAADIDVDANLLVRLAPGTSVEEYAADLAGGEPARLVEVPTQQVEVAVLSDVQAIPLFLGGFVAVIATLAVAHASRGCEPAAQRRPRRAAGARPAAVAGVRCRALAAASPSPWPDWSSASRSASSSGRMVWSAIAGSVSVPVVTDLPALPLVVTGIVTVGLAAVVAIPPGRRVAQLRPADLLRAE